MQPEQAAVKRNTDVIFGELDSQTNGNFKVGLVGFGNDRPPVSRDGIRLLSKLTNNRQQFQLASQMLRAEGNTERGYDSIYRIATGTIGIAFEQPRSSFCIIVITNEPSNEDVRTVAEVNAVLTDNNGFVFPVIDANVPGSFASYAPISFDQATTYDLNDFLRNPGTILSDVLTTCVEEGGFAPTISAQPSSPPSSFPSVTPSDNPSIVPTSDPSLAPTGVPTRSPSFSPTALPTTFEPSHVPSGVPSESPSNFPTREPSHVPSGAPTDLPSFSPSDSTRMVVTRKCGKVVYLCGLHEDMLRFSANKKHQEKASLGRCNVGGIVDKVHFVEEAYPDCLNHDFAAHCPNGKAPGKTIFGVCDNAMDLECRCCNKVNFKTLFRHHDGSYDSEDHKDYSNELEDKTSEESILGDENEDSEEYHDNSSDADDHDGSSDDHDHYSDEDDHDSDVNNHGNDETDHDDSSDEHNHDNSSNEDDHKDESNDENGKHNGNSWNKHKNKKHWERDKQHHDWKGQVRKLTETDYSTWPEDKSTCGRKQKESSWR